LFGINSEVRTLALRNLPFSIFNQLCSALQGVWTVSL
jgi:hypothetical protein